MATDDKTLEAQNQRLTLERDNAKLRSEIASLNIPWWRRVGIVSGITATIAAVIPITAGIQGYFSKQKELGLAAQKAEHDLHVAYLERVAEAGEHGRALRFIAATSDDADIVSWAKAEEERVAVITNPVEAEILALVDELKDPALTPEQRDERYKRLEVLLKLRNATARPPTAPVFEDDDRVPGTGSVSPNPP